MRRWLAGLFLVVTTWGSFGAPATGEPWVLQTGPEPVDSIPLVPVQLVSAWRGLYTTGDQRVWVFLTSSPYFSPPSDPGVRSLTGSPWTATAFFPSGWSAAAKGAWLDRWAAEFRSLSSLASPGWPVLFPSVLTKG